MVYLLLIICLVGIFYLSLAVLALYFVVTDKDKNFRATHFENVVGCGAVGLVTLGIGVAGLLYLYSYSPSLVSVVVLCLIALPAFLFAMYGLVKWIDAAKYKEFTDEKGEATAFMILGTVVSLIAFVIAYSNK